MSSKKLRLLFLAFAFPPSRAVGALRAWYMAKHLAELNWAVNVLTIDPVMLTSPAENINVTAECTRMGINRILTDHKMRFAYGGWLKLRFWERSKIVTAVLRRLFERLDIDAGIGWIRPGIRACEKFVREDFDLILATGSPFSAFRIAQVLSQRLNLPYVLDYRDLWTQDAHRKHRARRNEIRKEAEILRGASGYITVSESLSKSLSSAFGMKEQPHVITNGFDPEELSAIKPVKFEDFSVVYAGSFYEGKRSIRPVLEAVLRANDQINGRKPLRLHYYGSGGDHVRRVAEDLGALQLVIIHGLVSRKQALGSIKGCDVDVVITSVQDEGSLEDRGIITAKIFEAIGLGSRIMLIAPRGSDAGKIVERLGAGRHFLGSQVEEMAQWLVELYRNGARQEYAGSEEFSWPNIAQKLDRYLRGVIHRHQERISAT